MKLSRPTRHTGAYTNRQKEIESMNSNPKKSSNSLTEIDSNSTNVRLIANTMGCRYDPSLGDEYTTTEEDLRRTTMQTSQPWPLSWLRSCTIDDAIGWYAIYGRSSAAKAGAFEVHGDLIVSKAYLSILVDCIILHAEARSAGSIFGTAVIAQSGLLDL